MKHDHPSLRCPSCRSRFVKETSADDVACLDCYHQWDKKMFRYRWYHNPTGKTGTRDRKFTSEKTFLACLEYWNTWTDWKYLPVEDADEDDHVVETDSVYAGPFQFYGI